MAEGVGRALHPAKFDVDKFKHAAINKEEATAQVTNSDYDKSKLSNLSPAEVRKLHLRADVDLSHRSLHHTLGLKHNQASPGNHNHDSITSKKVGPREMDPVNLGKTRAQWTIPLVPTVADIVGLLDRFVEFRQV